MNKSKVLFSLFSALAVLLTGCGEEGGNQQKEKFIKVKGNESVEVTSPASYSLKDFNFYELAPVFQDSHIDHFVIAIHLQRVITNVKEDGFFTLDIALTAKASGNLYFNVDYQIAQELQDAFRIELYSQSLNKSVIYSFKGGESITEGTADLNADGQPDKDPQTGEDMIYTTGEHSYNTEAFNTNPYTSVNENDQINIKATVFFDGFHLQDLPGIQNPSDLNMLFEIR